MSNSKTILKISNDFSFLITDAIKVKHKIWDCLRFRELNYFHNSRYRMGMWDGYTEFFKLETGKFLTGLLPEVISALKHFNLPYEIQDERTKTPFLYPEIKEDFFNNSLPPGYNPVKLHDYQVELVNKVIKHKRGVIFAPTSAGKAQPLNSLVATPMGFKKMGEITVGDDVLVPSGGSAKVSGVFPQGKKKILKIIFSNGDSVECCEDHLWKVNALCDKYEGKILNAKTIKNKLKCPNGENRFDIDSPKSIDFKDQIVPIDPYLMGLLLGKGSFQFKNSIGIKIKELEILNNISSSLIDNCCIKQSKNKKFSFKITCKQKNPYVSAIKKLGLYEKKANQKFVPQPYLYNNKEKRLALLQGLMDANGNISKKGKMIFISKSLELTESVKWLVQSLGGVSCKSKKIKKVYYAIYFTLPENIIPFKLKWKKNRCSMRCVLNENRKICDVVEIGYKECQCIMVDHPEHLYVTDNFIITHNTFIMLGILRAIPPNTPTLVLQNRVGLAEQNYSEITKWGVQNVGTLWGKNVNPNIITVASVQSVAKMEKSLSKIKVVIVDEIHDMMSSLPKAIYRRLKNCDIRVALSATPFKFGEKDKVQKYYVKGFFGPVLEIKSAAGGVLTTKELQNRGILSLSNCVFYPINEPAIPYDIYMDAVTRGIAENFNFHKIVTKLAKKQTGRTLILVDRIAHGDALHSLLPGSLWVQGKDDSKTRKGVIDTLQKSKNNVIAIATQQIFNTGINVFIHNLINAAGGKADHQIIQRMGRGLRIADDKDGLNYYDFLFNINPYLLDHSQKRIKILKEQGHNVAIKEGIDF
jgi:superfamily II DNA or RNA helicase